MHRNTKVNTMNDEWITELVLGIREDNQTIQVTLDRIQQAKQELQDFWLCAARIGRTTRGMRV